MELVARVCLFLFNFLLIQGQKLQEDKEIIDYGRLIIKSCPTSICSGRECAVYKVSKSCEMCVCPIGSKARGCDPIPFVIWHDLMKNGCPIYHAKNFRVEAKVVTRWFRRVNRFTQQDECTAYKVPFCEHMDDLWRSPETKEECEHYCYPPKNKGIEDLDFSKLVQIVPTE